MPTIKVIPTVYKGIKFRSRLEARWAIFFDGIGIKWMYEYEGFDLGDGVWYLPDFYLPEWKTYVEIKPPGDDFEKALRFVNKTGQDIFLCDGTPEARTYRFVTYEGPSFTIWYDVAFRWNSASKKGGTVWALELQEEDERYIFNEEECLMNPRYMKAVYHANNYDFSKRR